MSLWTDSECEKHGPFDDVCPKCPTVDQMIAAGDFYGVACRVLCEYEHGGWATKASFLGDAMKRCFDAAARDEGARLDLRLHLLEGALRRCREEALSDPTTGAGDPWASVVLGIIDGVFPREEGDLRSFAGRDPGIASGRELANLSALLLDREEEAAALRVEVKRLKGAAGSVESEGGHRCSPPPVATAMGDHYTCPICNAEHRIAAGVGIGRARWIVVSETTEPERRSEPEPTPGCGGHAFVNDGPCANGCRVTPAQYEREGGGICPTPAGFHARHRTAGMPSANVVEMRGRCWIDPTYPDARCTIECDLCEGDGWVVFLKKNGPQESRLCPQCNGAMTMPRTEADPLDEAKRRGAPLADVIAERNRPSQSVLDEIGALHALARQVRRFRTHRNDASVVGMFEMYDRWVKTLASSDGKDPGR